MTQEIDLVSKNEDAWRIHKEKAASNLWTGYVPKILCFTRCN